MNPRSSYAGPIVQALVTQAVVTIFCSGFKDGGFLLAASMIASGLFWLCAIGMVVRGASGLGRNFVRWGLVPFALIGTPLIRSFLGDF
jgi:hypothetical protein